MQNKSNKAKAFTVMILLFLLGAAGYILYLVKGWKLAGAIGLILLGGGFLMVFIDSVRRIKRINAEKENGEKKE